MKPRFIIKDNSIYIITDETNASKIEIQDGVATKTEETTTYDSKKDFLYTFNEIKCKFSSMFFKEEKSVEELESEIETLNQTIANLKKPQVEITAKAPEEEDEKLEKLAIELQSNVNISGENQISGEINYTETFTEFSENGEEQEGNYLMMKFETPGADKTIVMLSENDNVKSFVKLDETNLCIFRISSNNEIITVTSYKGEHADVKKYTLNLTLTPKSLPASIQKGQKAVANSESFKGNSEVTENDKK